MPYINLAEFPGSESAPNFKKLLMTRPNVLAAWDNLLDAIKETQDFRTYELVTLAAAKQLKSSYCVLAHSSVLAAEEMDLEDIANMIATGASDNLSEKELAVMEFAGSVAQSPNKMKQSDVDKLRELGLNDSEIFDIAATAAARGFLTRLMDSLGLQPDAHFSNLSDSVKEKLVVGRPIEGT